MNNLLKNTFMSLAMVGIVAFAGQNTALAQQASSDQTAVSQQSTILKRNQTLIRRFNMEKDVAKSANTLRQILSGMQEELGAVKMNIAMNNQSGDAQKDSDMKIIDQLGPLYNKILVVSRTQEDVQNNKPSISEMLGEYLKMH